MHCVFTQECIVFIWPQLTQYGFLTPIAHLACGQCEPNWALASLSGWPPIPARLVSRATGPAAERSVLFLWNSMLRTPGLTRLAAESERIGTVDNNSVFILHTKNSALYNILLWPYPRSGNLVLCTHRSRSPPPSTPPPPPLPLPTQTAIMAGSDGPWKK